MQARIRLNNIEDSGYSVNVHVRKITNGAIVNAQGKETAYEDVDVAVTEFREAAEAQKADVKAAMQQQIEKIQAGLDNVDAAFTEAMTQAEKDIELLTPKDKTNGKVQP